MSANPSPLWMNCVYDAAMSVAIFHLQDQIADPVAEQVLERNLLVKGNAESIAERHLGDSGCGAVAVHE